MPSALRELQADFSKERWRDELPDISEVSGIMRRLQANEVELGDAQKTVKKLEKDFKRKFIIE